MRCGGDGPVTGFTDRGIPRVGPPIEPERRQRARQSVEARAARTQPRARARTPERVRADRERAAEVSMVRELQ